MNIEGDKIKALIDEYGKRNGYPEKSYIPKFCEDFELNYIQWSAYVRRTQKAGIKIIYKLMDIFPNLNLNWLLKDDLNMFTDESFSGAREEKATYKKPVTNEEIMIRLEEIEKILKKGNIVIM